MLQARVHGPNNELASKHRGASCRRCSSSWLVEQIKDTLLSILVVVDRHRARQSSSRAGT